MRGAVNNGTLAIYPTKPAISHLLPLTARNCTQYLADCTLLGQDLPRSGGAWLHRFRFALGGSGSSLTASAKSAISRNV